MGVIGRRSGGSVREVSTDGCSAAERQTMRPGHDGTCWFTCVHVLGLGVVEVHMCKSYRENLEESRGLQLWKRLGIR